MALTRYSIKKPVNALLNRNVKQSPRENHYMLVLVSEAKFVSRQGLPLRKDSQPGSSTAEPNSNTHQLLQSYGRISKRAEYLQQKNKIHSSVPVQNEILGIQAKIIPRQLADKLQKSRWYSIIVDRDLGRYKERAGCHLL